MIEFISNHLPECCIAISIIVLMFLPIDFIRDHFLPVKYKLDKDGYVMFYYPYYNTWEYIPAWNKKDEVRQVQVFDRVRDLNYTISYVGPGRSRIFMPHTDVSKWKSSDIRKRFPNYKNAQQIWNEHCKLIDRENELLKKVVKDKVFA